MPKACDFGIKLVGEPVKIVERDSVDGLVVCLQQLLELDARVDQIGSWQTDQDVSLILPGFNKPRRRVSVDSFRELLDDRLDLVLVFALICSRSLKNQDRPPVGVRVKKILATLRNETIRSGLAQSFLVLELEVAIEAVYFEYPHPLQEGVARTVVQIRKKLELLAAPLRFDVAAAEKYEQSETRFNAFLEDGLDAARGSLQLVDIVKGNRLFRALDLELAGEPYRKNLVKVVQPPTPRLIVGAGVAQKRGVFELCHGRPSPWVHAAQDGVAKLLQG